MSSLQDNITQEVNSSNDDVKDRAQAEYADEEKRSITSITVYADKLVDDTLKDLQIPLKPGRTIYGNKAN